ncbi:uncharacterized protein LOC109822561 [Asparagus officinalis]|uniref:uncharacterized protein LOC109822561 n=1 Tax=Asparagus officinalis TaxID=4686 RepID=UPI00098E860B|nr:uncharacterized protein LOC109822561 [Asparagus officinalis]
MLSSLSMASPSPASSVSNTFTCGSQRSFRTMGCKKPSLVLPQRPISLINPSRALELAFPLAASISIILWSNPAHAGFLSGSSGLESIPGPELPKIDFLSKWNENNQKKYAELDNKFKSSTVLKELLEKSKQNKERNQKEIQDKYCLRGAEWGVGDCSAQGMTPEERDEFISMLKKKAGE